MSDLLDSIDTNPTLTAVDKLTQKHSHLFGPRELGDNRYEQVDYDPLLDSLRAAISSSLGKTAGGVSPANTRNALNLQAFELWELIDGLVRSWAQRLEVQRSDDLKQLLRRLYIRVEGMGKDERDPREFARMVKGWVTSIDNLFDPLREKELIADCPMPECGQRYVKDEHGDLRAALILYYRQDAQPEAKCRSCGTVWEGPRMLLTLGYSIGANTDEDALREMGVRV